MLPPFLQLGKDQVGCFLLFALVCMSGFLDEDQVVLCCCGHMIVEIAQEVDGIAVSEVIVGADKHRPCMSDLFGLGEVCVMGGMYVVQDPAEIPVIGSVCGALHPAHEGEGQHFVPFAPLDLSTKYADLKQD